jgi:capsular polysaccharide biosynthesis protein
MRVLDCCWGTAQQGWVRMYFCWVMHFLPRLSVISREGRDFDKIRFPERTTLWQHILFHLAISDLGLSENLFVGLDYPQSGLRVPSPRPFVSSLPWLRKVLLVDKSPGDKILYISRRYAKSRRIDSESEILRALDLEPTYLETIDPREQARLFYSAKLVIGPNGGGLTNIIFARPRTTVLEIGLAGHRRNQLARKMCEALRLKYRPFVCTTDYSGVFPLPGKVPSEFPGDYIVNLDDFVAVASREIAKIK